jgi:hypothetical protein
VVVVILKRAESALKDLTSAGSNDAARQRPHIILSAGRAMRPALSPPKGRAFGVAISAVALSS